MSKRKPAFYGSGSLSGLSANRTHASRQGLWCKEPLVLSACSLPKPQIWILPSARGQRKRTVPPKNLRCGKMDMSLRALERRKERRKPCKAGRRRMPFQMLSRSCSICPWRWVGSTDWCRMPQPGWLPAQGVLIHPEA